MKLTGKCKEDFRNYLTEFVGGGIKVYPYKVFRELEISMQYGVYVDFFDHHGICISGLPYTLIINEGSIQRFKINFGGFERYEGRLMAIEKANEIYNNNL